MSVYEGVPGLSMSHEDQVLRLTIDLAERRNALDDVVVAAMIDAVDAAGRDEDGPGHRAHRRRRRLLLGLRHRRRATPAVARRPRVGSIQRRLPSQAHRLIPLMLRTQVPIVSVVRGWAAGIGLNLALASDFTVAADDARFWEPFVGRGFTPDSGATWLLPRRIGEVRARDMLLLGRVVSGAEAADWGMVHRAVPADELDAVADELVGTLAQAPDGRPRAWPSG